MYESTKILQSSTETFRQDFPSHLSPKTASKQMNNLKDNSELPKITTKNLTAAKLSLTFGDKRAKKVAAFLGENNDTRLVLSQNVVEQRPMTAITVTRKGEIKQKIVSAPIKGFGRIRGQADNTEMVVLFPSGHQKQQQSELDSQIELSNHLSRLSVLQPLDEIRTSLVTKNEKIYHRNKNIQNTKKDVCGGNTNAPEAMNALPRFSRSLQQEKLPLIGAARQNLKKSSGKVKDRGIELENHLKKADEDYDEYVEKASILYNWLTSQSTLK